MRWRKRKAKRMDMKRIAGLLITILCLWTGAAVAQDEQQNADKAYEVQPGDLLLISVWKEPDLQQEVLVRPDGAFSFPLVGEINGLHRTIEELRVELSTKLSRYIPDLVVTVSILEINGNKIYIMGQVNQPGEFVVNPRVDVMQALAMAGGTTPFADLNDIKILRRSGETQTVLDFRYNNVARGRDLEQNIVLQSGDIVVVP